MENNSKEKTENGSSISVLKRRVIITAACFFAVLVLLIGVMVGVFFALKTSGRLSIEERRKNELTAMPDYVYDPNTVSYNGKKYKYNENVTTFLFMGIDTGRLDETAWQRAKALAKQTGKSVEQMYQRVLQIYEELELHEPKVGHSDVLLLVVLDETKKHASIISIDRNSMSYFEAYDDAGNPIGSSEGQLALSYSYGDGAHESCKMTARAVSDFLYEIPIHAYYSMKYKAIKELNDAVGGVKVTISTDMTEVNEAFIKGETVTLDGEMAAMYLSARRDVGDGSNESRLERQKQYIFSFIETAISAIKKDWGLPADLYERLAGNSCTDLSADEVVYLASLAPGLDISYHSIKGTTDTDGAFAEFRPDEDALWQLILDIFYICED